VAADGDAVVDRAAHERALAAPDGKPIDAATQPLDAAGALDRDRMNGLGHGTIMAEIAAF